MGRESLRVGDRVQTMRIADALELFEERSSIIEFDGNVSRQVAEKQAMEEICKRHGSWLRVPIQEAIQRKRQVK